MKTLYIERSVGTGRDGGWVEELDLDGVERIVVGTGPGSFAGVRSAIAFAKGFALGRKCEVLGLPSPCAVAAQVFSRGESGARQLAVVGDARCGKLWVALFSGWSLVQDVFQTTREELGGAVPQGFLAVTTEEGRIGPLMKETFGPRYLGGMVPTSEGLGTFAERNPGALSPDPLPIYLNPAVRNC